MPEGRFRALFEASPIGIFLASLDGTIIEANLAAANLLGRSRENLIGCRSASLTHPDDVAVSHQLRQLLVEGKIERYRIR